MFLKPTGFFDPLYAYDAPDAAFPKLVRRLVRAGDWAIDVGGEKGWNALTLWRAVGPSGRVITVEADPRAADVLQANLDRNGASTVTLIRQAAGDCAGTATMQLNETFGWSSLTPSEMQSRSVVRSVDVPTQTLDAILASQLPRDARVSFMKLDIEGSECRAVRGAERILSQHRPVLYLEVNPPSLAAAGASAAELGALLAPYGYRFWSTHGEYLGFSRWRAWFRPVPSLADVREQEDVIGVPPELLATWAPILDAASSADRPMRDE
jgi:FkbM family methyltransferase